MCSFVVLVGPLFVWFVLLSSPRVALLDCSVLLLSSLCFVLLCLASLILCFFGILILPSPPPPSQPPYHPQGGLIGIGFPQVFGGSGGFGEVREAYRKILS